MTVCKVKLTRFLVIDEVSDCMMAECDGEMTPNMVHVPRQHLWVCMKCGWGVQYEMHHKPWGYSRQLEYLFPPETP